MMTAIDIADAVECADRGAFGGCECGRQARVIGGGSSTCAVRRGVVQSAVCAIGCRRPVWARTGRGTRGRTAESILDPLCRAAADLLGPNGTVLVVHSEFSDCWRTLALLAGNGFVVSEAARRAPSRSVPSHRRARWLEGQGRSDPGRRTEELVGLCVATSAESGRRTGVRIVRGGPIFRGRPGEHRARRRYARALGPVRSGDMYLQTQQELSAVRCQSPGEETTEGIEQGRQPPSGPARVRPAGPRRIPVPACRTRHRHQFEFVT